MGEKNTVFANCLLLDLEATQTGKVLKIGAVLGDRTFLRSGAFDLNHAVSDLDALAADAICVAGHNLLLHDLGILADKFPNLALLRLPVIDTLFLSPICFPENPYHRLVKDYKLVSESVNDPVADAHLAGVLFDDELRSLAGTAEGHPAVFRCLRTLLADGRGGDERLAHGMELVFEAATDERRVPAEGNPLAELRTVLASLPCCRTAAESIADADLATQDGRWALAYVLTWLRVAGGDSVLPPWVRLHNAAVVPLLKRLREVPCDTPACAYCRAEHNAEVQLKTFFDFPEFRKTPVDADGKSLQRKIVVAGMRGESLLAIMPTGGGKSLCFQLPALVRNFRRGELTVTVSPLQALMKDQVDGLRRRTGRDNIAALNGLLTSPERGEVLRGIRSGSVAVLYVSPEQLRSPAFRGAVSAREIGCWVLDEAHCLSKWGHDFRPDYLYVGRFIREVAASQGGQMPAIACFTATAKRDVIEEIIEYFRRETGVELTRYEGGVERDNLRFEVQTVGVHAKLARIDDLLRTRLQPDGPGSAVVFRATRRETEETADFLRQQNWSVERFHAGLTVPEKKRVQDAFLAGDVRIICATNAFGMGIDKDDVRLVIHGDTPGSLENYLQEAGRAGRDRHPADCVLLYDEEDCEQQFRLSAHSELSRHDIAQILRGLRKASSTRKSDEVVITTGELLRDEDVETEFGARDAGADTKVRAAVSWLERAGFVERNENRTNVVQARLLVKSLEDARQRLAGLNLSEREVALWLAIIREMMNAAQTDLLSVDEIALLPEFQDYYDAGETDVSAAGVREVPSQEYLSAKVLKVLTAMMGVGILKKDTLLTAYVRYKVADHSGVRLARILETDRAFLKLLCELEPDPEGWMPLDVRLINQELIDRDSQSSPELVRSLLRSLSEDGRGFSGQRGSIELRFLGREACRVRVCREWGPMGELAERRRQVAECILAELLRQVPANTPAMADLLVEFHFEQLQRAIEADLALRSAVKDMQSAIERGLMFLHEQKVIVLQKGLAIFRSAMTVRVLPEANKQRYTTENYEALQHHYQERVFQIHVMNEYARHGLEKIRAALDLVVAYFTMDKELFIRRFFGDRRELLERATTAESHRAIVDALENRDQIRIVMSPVRRNLLILAGPGSGKTRTVVHRCAYLLRVRRVKPRSILVCCFNHRAAVELRRRLAALVGKDAIGVTIQTYHGLALRLLGMSCSNGMNGDRPEIDFDKLIADAVQVLRGDQVPAGMEPDEVRDRLLAGFEHVLVDEYQDIDAPQYEMISAIAGRTQQDQDRKLSILAVGDDDQSIYGFRGANVSFIRRFQEDYKAEVAYLVENYRSTRHIIEASNRIVRRNRDRMKTGREIRIDQGREMLPPGGRFGEADAETRGRVAVVEVGDAWAQAAAVIREIKRLRELDTISWNEMAVLSRTRRDLAMVRALAEQENVPVSWPLDRAKMPPLHRFREISVALNRLREVRSTSDRGSSLIQRLELGKVDAEGNPWACILAEVLAAWQDETNDEPAPVQTCIEFVCEALAQRRRDERIGKGVVLNTVHAAKGTEYDHVLLCGDWSEVTPATLEEERRVLYVGMTRARKTLAIFNRMDRRSPFASEFVGPCFAHRRKSELPATRTRPAYEYTLLGLDDMFLDFAGRHEPGHSIHQTLATLSPGAKLLPVCQDERVKLAGTCGVPLAQLSSKAAELWHQRLTTVESARVVGMIVRKHDDGQDSEYRDRLRTDQWEIPLCEFMWRA